MLTSIPSRAFTYEDRKLFFEALGEYGKDFQNIQQYMTQKGSQKSGNNGGTNANGGSSNNNYTSNNSAISNGNTTNTNGTRASEPNKLIDLQEKREFDKKEDDRKREKIRTFYNKLYAKLSEFIGKIDDRVEKVNQELYLLINYGEIWKRHGFEKFSSNKRLLEELVYQGTTTFRLEKKNVRLRTPTCKALKKINKIGVDEEVKVVTTRELPKDVVVELHPASNRDWLAVQSISQNPRVRARLSIQKRLTSIIDYLESKWNLSPEKLERTVDGWLKVSIGSHQNSECAISTNVNNQSTLSTTTNGNNNNGLDQHDILNTNASPHERLRLKPSSHHELKEVNITRVVPDNHLDLSLNAYINRLQVAHPKCEQSSKEQAAKRESDHPDTNHHSHHAQMRLMAGDNPESSSFTTRSRLPVSLTTPDCSILLERSCTSDQPSIAQARKHLNSLQSLIGTLEGCENSRTAYDDTQDRSLMSMLMNHNSRSVTFAPIGQSHHMDQEPTPAMQPSPTISLNKDISALYDEDAALPVSSSGQQTSHTETSSFGINNSTSNNHHPMNTDSQNSKSVDFQIPKNVTLGDFFKMSEPSPSDNNAIVVDTAVDEAANDAFPTGAVDKMDEDCDLKDVDRESEEHFGALQTKDNGLTNGQVKLQNHVIEIKKFAEGWTRQDEPSITLGELYLAFKCPDKIVLEYQFETPQQSENISSDDMNNKTDNPNSNNATAQSEESLNSNLISRLLTAASLSLARIERSKQEQQRKLHEAQQSCSKLKRRKGSGQGQGQTMTIHDIEATNQRVEEALKQLQPIRLSSFKRTR